MDVLDEIKQSLIDHEIDEIVIGYPIGLNSHQTRMSNVVDEFIENEIVEKISENEAKVSFTIINLDGLTQLSSSEDITAREKELGIITEIL